MRTCAPSTVIDPGVTWRPEAEPASTATESPLGADLLAAEVGRTSDRGRMQLAEPNESNQTRSGRRERALRPVFRTARQIEVLNPLAARK